MFKRLVSAVLALSLAFSCAALTKPVSAEAAGTKTMYVVKSLTWSDSGTKSTRTYTYDSTGLLSKMKEKCSWYDGSDGKGYSKYKYDEDYRITEKESSNAMMNAIGLGMDSTTTYDYSKDNEIRDSYGTIYATDDRGRIIGESYDNDNGYLSYKYEYDNKNRVSKEIYTIKRDEGDDVTTTEYKYDKKGNLSKVKHDTYSEKRKITYDKNGRITKVKMGSSTYKVKYKKIKIKADAIDKVKAQQWSILNENNNFAFF